MFVFVASHFIHPSNYHPFIPEGWSGVLTGGSIIFFTYIGLDAVSNYARIMAHRRRTGRGRHDRLIYPWPLRYNRHAEFGCQPLVPRTTLDELLSAFEEARRFGGDFCLATHYWEIDDRLAGMLDAFIAHADRAGVTWVPADELFVEP